MPTTPCLQPLPNPLKHPSPSDQSSFCMNFKRNYACPNSPSSNYPSYSFQTSCPVHKCGPCSPDPFLDKNAHCQHARFTHVASYPSMSQRHFHDYKSLYANCPPDPCTGTFKSSSSLPAPYTEDAPDTAQPLVRDPSYYQDSSHALQPDYSPNPRPPTTSPHSMYYRQSRPPSLFPRNYSTPDSGNSASYTKDCICCFNSARTAAKDKTSDNDSDSVQSQGLNSATHFSYAYSAQSAATSSSNSFLSDAAAVPIGCKHSKLLSSSSPKDQKFAPTTNSGSSATPTHYNAYKLYEICEGDNYLAPSQSNVPISVSEKSAPPPDGSLHSLAKAEPRMDAEQLEGRHIEKETESKEKFNKTQSLSAIGLPDCGSTRLNSLPFSSVHLHAASSSRATVESALDPENCTLPTSIENNKDNNCIHESVVAGGLPLNSRQYRNAAVGCKARDFLMSPKLPPSDPDRSTRPLETSNAPCSSGTAPFFRPGLPSSDRLDSLLLESDSLNSQLESASIAYTIIEKRFKDLALRNYTLKHLLKFLNEEVNATKTEMKESQAKLDTIKAKSESLNKEIDRLREERLSREGVEPKTENASTVQKNRMDDALGRPVRVNDKNAEVRGFADEGPTNFQTNQNLLVAIESYAKPQEPYYKLERPILIKSGYYCMSQKSVPSLFNTSSNVSKLKPPLRHVDEVPGYYYDLNLSPLRAFRAFRFCEQFPWKNLLSVTWTNNLNPYQKFCTLDIRGRCNGKCKYQHEHDYTLSKKGLLEEYLSYLDSSNAAQLEELRSDNRPLLEKLVKIVRLVRQQINSPAIVHSLALQRSSTFRNRYKRNRKTLNPKCNKNETNGGDSTQGGLDELGPPKPKKRDVDEIRDQADVIYINTIAAEQASSSSANNDQTLPGSADENDQETLGFDFFSSLIDELNLSNLAGQSVNEREDALVKLSGTLEEHPTAPLLWACYLHIFLKYSQQKEDIHEAFDRAIKSCPNCSVLWVYGIVHIPFTSYLSKLKFIKKSVDQFERNRCNSFGFMECLTHLLTFSNNWPYNQSLLNMAFTYDWLEPRYRLACKLWIFYYIGHHACLSRNELLSSITNKSYLFDWTNLKKSALERLEKGFSKLLSSAEFKDIPLLLDNAFAFYAQNGWTDRATSLSMATSEAAWQIKAKMDKAKLIDAINSNSIEHSRKCANPEYVYQNARAILYLDLGFEGLERILSMIRTLVYVKTPDEYGSSAEPLSDQDITKIWAHFCYLLSFPLKRLFPNKSTTVLSHLQSIFTSTERSRTTKNPHWWLCFIIFSTITNPFDTHLRTKIQEVSRNMLGFEKLTSYMKEYTWIVLSIIKVYQCQIPVMIDDKKVDTDSVTVLHPPVQLPPVIQKSMTDVSDNQSLLFTSLSHTLSYLVKKPTNEHPFLYTFNREYAIELTKQLELSNMTIEQAFKLVKKAQIDVLRDWSGINQCVHLLRYAPHLLPEIYSLSLKKCTSTNINLLLESYKTICKRSGIHGNEYFERTVLPVFKKQKNCDVTVEQWAEAINIAAEFNLSHAKILLKDAIAIHPWSDTISLLRRQICQDDEN